MISSANLSRRRGVSTCATASSVASASWAWRSVSSRMKASNRPMPIPVRHTVPGSEVWHPPGENLAVITQYRHGQVIIKDLKIARQCLPREGGPFLDRQFVYFYSNRCCFWTSFVDSDLHRFRNDE